MQQSGVGWGGGYPQNEVVNTTTRADCADAKTLSMAPMMREERER